MAYRPPGAGQLREKVKIERRSKSSDGMGGVNLTGWTTVASGLPAQISPVRGGEDVRSLRLSGTSLYDVTVRSSANLSAIDATHRIVNERTGQTYNVKWVANLDERGRFLTFTVEAGGLQDG